MEMTLVKTVIDTEVNAHYLFANGSISGWVISRQNCQETEVTVKTLIDFI